MSHGYVQYIGGMGFQYKEHKFAVNLIEDGNITRAPLLTPCMRKICLLHSDGMTSGSMVSVLIASHGQEDHNPCSILARDSG